LPDPAGALARREGGDLRAGQPRAGGHLAHGACLPERGRGGGARDAARLPPADLLPLPRVEPDAGEEGGGGARLPGGPRAAPARAPVGGDGPRGAGEDAGGGAAGGRGGVGWRRPSGWWSA